MSAASSPASPNPRRTTVRSTPILNAFEILNSATLKWDVKILEVQLKDKTLQGFGDLGDAKGVVWDLRREHRSACKGYGFIVDAGKRLVAIPNSWNLPLPLETETAHVLLYRQFTADSATELGRRIICAIAREAIKKHFKDKQSPELGPLWQDFQGFAQIPTGLSSGYLMCRKFTPQLKALAGGRLVLQCNVSTVTVDHRTIQQHYEFGTMAELGEMIEMKRADRFTRQNRPITVRAIQQFPSGGACAVELTNIDALLGDAALSEDRQRERAVSAQIECRVFPRQPSFVPASEVRLILDSQITGEDHSDTIIEPSDRISWAKKVRDFLDGVDAFGCKLEFGLSPVALGASQTFEVLPPATRVMGKDGKEFVIPSPFQFSPQSLQHRVRTRAEHVRRNGFLLRRLISPALAFPKRSGKARAERLKSDLERIWRSQGIEVNFALCLYESVDQIRSYIEHQNHTAVFAVLPDDRAESAEDCYNLIKRKIEVPSQCMQHQHLLPARLTNLSHAELQHVDPKKARRVSQTYEICLANLLVKHHWFPFAPRDRFNYNVQLGLDVGGVHNTSVMACFGYGFSTPETGIFLRPDEIPVSSAKVEPIPQTALFKGLLSIFEQARQELAEVPMPVDFSKTLFYRDGQLLGDGDDWNELEALKDLHEELRRRNWIPEGSVWTAVEILKGGHGWRIFNDNGQIENPIVGQCCFPFEEPNIGLVATTGAPYLTQGTAQPILIRIHDVAGKADRLEVVRDLVWQADMCFTKVDMGMSLPWVLNVADAGALQLARSYLIAGITT